eukprot:2807787-Amphidinium_carterae.1
MSAVAFFIIDDNIFTGMFPDSLQAMSEVRLLETTSNRFTGRLPENGLRAFKLVIKLETGANGFMGALPDSVQAMRTMVGLGVSKNSFTGMLPCRGIQAMIHLRRFLAGVNRFTGSLSDTFLRTADRAVDLAR